MKSVHFVIGGMTFGELVAGERGEPVHIAPDEQQKADRSIREYGFNMVASDKIAMNRTIPDLRMSE